MCSNKCGRESLDHRRYHFTQTKQNSLNVPTQHIFFCIRCHFLPKQILIFIIFFLLLYIFWLFGTQNCTQIRTFLYKTHSNHWYRNRIGRHWFKYEIFSSKITMKKNYRFGNWNILGHYKQHVWMMNSHAKLVNVFHWNAGAMNMLIVKMV